MSHTIGQITENNQKSKADQESLAVESQANSGIPLLSDADYEFLFNQLLEGIAHGWHDRRIIKFFNQLGDRGKQEDWIAWLERLRPKVISLPIQSKQQLGSIMIRLGELTQSTAEIRQIGIVSNRIGRELLFGNVEDIIWEYVGPDLHLDSPVTELETEATFSQRLPEDFADLGLTSAFTPSIAPNAETESAVELELQTSAAESRPITPISEQISHPPSDPAEQESLLSEELETHNLMTDFITDESLEITASETLDDLDVDSLSNNNSSRSMINELQESLSSNDDLIQAQDDFIAMDKFSDEFEFEPETEASESIIDNSNKASVELAESAANVADNYQQEQLLNSFNSANSLGSVMDSSDPSLSTELSKLDPVAIDMEQVMNLIQEDEKLAQEISRKLNISPAEPAADSASITSPADLDRSSIELIEGWFNLGLKQVSGGEFDKAIASWEKALKINPNLSEAWHNRGSALGRLGRYKEAIESFQKALEIDPDNYQAWNDRAHALYQLENWAAAADSWSNAIKITPANHLFWYNRGCALEQLESWAESISSYEKSLEIKPDFQPARLRYTNLIADNSHSN